MYEPVISPTAAAGRYGGARRLGTPESQRKARAMLTAAKLDKAICDALNAGDLPANERQRLVALLSGGAQ
jgi:hypothetical protein